MIFIIIVLILSIFAYFLGNDGTPNSNRMNLELNAKEIGYKQKFLLVPKEYNVPKNSFLKKLFVGQPDSFDFVPIQSLFIANDELNAIHQIDDHIFDTLQYPFHLIKEEGFTNDIGYIEHKYTKEHTYILGTDRYGRDVWSRLILGARVSLSVGIVSVLISVSIGVLLGAIAGWKGGMVDKIIMYLVNVLWSIPTILLVFAITLSIGKGFWELFLAIGLSSWVGIARMVRGQVMQIKELDFIVAARTLGLNDIRIIWKHILPNIVGPIIVLAAANFATAILVEAGLSFLGIGIQPPMPSWGLMIKEHYNFLLAGKPAFALIPGIAIMLLVLAINIIGNRLRDVYDVRKV